MHLRRGEESGPLIGTMQAHSPAPAAPPPPPAPPPLRRSVTVRVPATSANLGAGFDCIGLALNVFNDVRVTTCDAAGRAHAETRIESEGEGAESLPRDASNLVVRGMNLALRAAGYNVPAEEGDSHAGAHASARAAAPSQPQPLGAPPHLHYFLRNRIPIGAGLGSSSAAIVGGLLAGLALTGRSLAVTAEEAALQLASTVEGHVDNLAPCIYGGCQIGVHTGARWNTTAVPVPAGLQCIVFTPAARQSTEGARAILPPSVSRAEAVFNIGRAALLVAAFASGNLDDLALATQDALHQPARERIMPWLAPCVAAALGAGAKGAFLSGAGSSVMALSGGRKGDIHGQRAAERRDVAVARAMARAAHAAGTVGGRCLITHPSTIGAHVTELDGDPNADVSGSGLLSFDYDAGEDAAGFAPSASPRMPAAAAFAPSPAAAASPPLQPALRAALEAAAADGGAAAASVTYVSTRAGAGAGSGSARLSFREVVFAGLAPDGGLYVPAGGAAAFPRLPAGALRAWRPLPYFEVAFRVLSLFVGPDQVPAEDLRSLCRRSYGAGTEAERAGWAVAAVAPLVAVPLPGAAAQGSGAGAGAAPPRLLVAEHFHGPTCAFKDLALQFVGNLFEWLLAREAREARESSEANGSGGSGASGPPRRLLVLGATSGDTGSAAIAGLRGKRGVDTVILHPAGRVAAVQALQMTTVLDASVHNVAVSGATFDDCQAAVKAAFVDPAFRARHRLTAINSINWARILAQVCYSVWSYIRFLEVKDAEALAAGAGAGAGAPLPEATFIVPSGNMGNALSVLYARRLGVPLARVAVATNENDVLHRLISAGDFARAPAGVAGTLAPSMDIAAPSNLERYVFEAAEAAEGAGRARARVGGGEPGRRAAALAARGSRARLCERARERRAHRRRDPRLPRGRRRRLRALPALGLRRARGALRAGAHRGVRARRRRALRHGAPGEVRRGHARIARGWALPARRAGRGRAAGARGAARAAAAAARPERAPEPLRRAGKRGRGGGDGARRRARSRREVTKRGVVCTEQTPVSARLPTQTRIARVTHTRAEQSASVLRARRQLLDLARRQLDVHVVEIVPHMRGVLRARVHDDAHAPLPRQHPLGRRAAVRRADGERDGVVQHGGGVRRVPAWVMVRSCGIAGIAAC